MAAKLGEAGNSVLQTKAMPVGTAISLALTLSTDVFSTNPPLLL